MLRFCIVFLALFTVTACAATPTPPQYPPFRFTDNAPYKLDVAEIQIVEEYKPKFKAPYVEHNFVVPPEDAIKQWVKDRLVASGSEGYLRVVIKDASVKEVALEPTQKGIKGLVTVEQSERYDANVQVDLEIYRGDNVVFPIADISLSAQKSKSIAENATLVQREQFYYDLTKSLMQGYDTQMDQYIRQYFNSYLTE